MRGPASASSLEHVGGEVSGCARIIRLAQGINIISFARSEVESIAFAELSLPATQITPVPRGESGVSIIFNSGDRKGWIGREGGTVIVEAGAGDSSIVATTYGITEVTQLQPVRVTNLAHLEQSEPLPSAVTPALEGRRIDVEMILHIEREGDRRFAAGDWAGNPGTRSRVEAFSLRPVDTLLPGQIEYMAYGPGGRQTPWATEARMCGTRGRGSPLTGFAIRVAPALRERFDIVYDGYFFAGGIAGPCRHGEPCMSPVIGDPLSAIRLYVIERAGA